MNRKRIVVTGYATLSCLGKNADEMWEALKQGKCGISTIEGLDTTGLATTIAGQIKNFEPSDYMDKKEARKCSRFAQFAVAASRMAYAMSGLNDENFNKKRMGVCFGSGIGGHIDTLEAVNLDTNKGPHSVPPLYVPKAILNAASAQIGISLGLKGPNFTLATACSSSTDSIVIAGDLIRQGRADIMVTGGCEAPIDRVSLAGFNKLMAMTTQYNDNPTKGSRPFDKDRSGFVMGEGAGVLILEEYEHAKARGANIICEYAGGAMTCDAFHITSPAADGSGAIEAMKLALEDAGLKPTDIDYINAHATSTPMNDPVESAAIVAVFGEHATSGKLLVSGTKSMTGHTLGAAGGIEAVITIKAMQDGFVPPTINLDNQDIEGGCILNCVPNVGVKADIKAVLSDSLGFGGHNGVVIFKKI